MRRIRVTGIVREANAVRRALSMPISGPQRNALVLRVRKSLQDIDRVLHEHGASIRHLPAPSRRAYDFLSSLDLTSVQVLDSPAAEPQGAPAPESISYRGLRSFLDRVLDDVAATLHAGRFNAAAMLGVIQRTARRLDYTMRRDGLQPAHLKPESRKLAGWFRHFSRDEAFETYVAAVRRAQSVLGRLPRGQIAWQLPLLVHYRPSSHLYRWREHRHGTRIVLGTAMVTFDARTLDVVGRQMLGSGRDGAAITAAMMAEPFQTMLVEFDAAAGVVDETRGLAHDLAEVFDRVNQAYFSGQMARPRLTWTRTLTGRVFGHYDFVHDRVCISSTLDRADMSPFVIDHVMHHELLHKKHGFRWWGQRQHTHTPAFRAEERTFPQYEQAARALEELCVAQR